MLYWRKNLKTGLNNLIHDLDNRNWVEQVVDDAVEGSMKSPQPTDHFYPSAAGSCPRLIQLNMFCLVKNDINCKTQRIFDNGNYVHQRYADYFKKSGKLIQEEAAFRFMYKDFLVSGRVDVVVKDYNDKKFIGEMKSANDKNFTERLITNSPAEDHIKKWNIYAFGLKILDGFVLYENKNDQRLLVFPMSFDQGIFDGIMAKFSFINDCTKAGKIVPKPNPCPDGRWCNARDFCKNDVEAQKVLSDTITTLMTKKLEK
jgi:hypothetical protein